MKRASGQLNFAHEKCKRRQGRTKFGKFVSEGLRDGLSLQRDHFM